MMLGKQAITVAITLTAALIGSGIQSAAAEDKNWWPINVEVYDPSCTNGDPACLDLPENSIAGRKTVEYSPLERAQQKWQICAALPHLKDSYWVGVNYGIIDEARRLGVKLDLYEAGGYTNLEKQISQVENCVGDGAKAVILAAISSDGNAKQIKEIHDKGVYVVDLVNGVNAPVDARSRVSQYSLGYMACKWVSEKHPAGSGKVKIGWFPGPPGAAWAVDMDKGCNDAIQGSDVEIIATKWGDTGKEIQTSLVEDVLQAQTSGGETDLEYIVGTATTAEAAASVVRARDLKGKIQIVGTYYTPGMHMLIERGDVVMAPSDQQVIQGRIAVDQAVRLLEGKPMATGGRPEYGNTGRTTEHIFPSLVAVDQEHYKAFDPATTLGPSDWKPEFHVE